MSLELPGRVIVAPPVVPTVTTAPPEPASVSVLPVVGPQGVPGGTGAMAYEHIQAAPVPAGHPLQIVHNLTFQPGGIVCLESDGVQIEYDSVTHPMPGVIELTFGVAFTGHIYLS